MRTMALSRERRKAGPSARRRRHIFSVCIEPLKEAASEIAGFAERTHRNLVGKKSLQTLELCQRLRTHVRE